MIHVINVMLYSAFSIEFSHICNFPCNPAVWILHHRRPGRRHHHHQFLTPSSWGRWVRMTYLTDLCRPVSDLASRRALRSSARGELFVPRARSVLKQRRAFSVIGPSTWNELPLMLCLLPQNNVSSFCKLLSLAVARLRAPLGRFL